MTWIILNMIFDTRTGEASKPLIINQQSKFSLKKDEDNATLLAMIYLSQKLPACHGQLASTWFVFLSVFYTIQPPMSDGPITGSATASVQLLHFLFSLKQTYKVSTIAELYSPTKPIQSTSVSSLKQWTMIAGSVC